MWNIIPLKKKLKKLILVFVEINALFSIFIPTVCDGKQQQQKHATRWGKRKKQAPSGIYPHRSNCQMSLASLVTCTQIMDIEYSSDRKRQKNPKSASRGCGRLNANSRRPKFFHQHNSILDQKNLGLQSDG